MSRFSRIHLLFLLLALALGLGVVVAAPEDPESARERLKQLREDKRQYARLRHASKAFQALTRSQQERLRKLDSDLHEQPGPKRERLFEVMRRYHEWLEDLDEKDRQRVRDAKDKYARLQLVKELRDREWIKRLPRAVRLELENTSNELSVRKVARTTGSLLAPNGASLLTAAFWLDNAQTKRDRLLAKHRKDENRRRLEWQLVYRHWRHWDYTLPVPSKLADFPPAVQLYVNKMLIPNLTEEEKTRLAKAERYVSASYLLDPFYRETVKKDKGKAVPASDRVWPLYPFVLVELADKYPLALPREKMPGSYPELLEVFPEAEKSFFKGKPPAPFPGKKLPQGKQFPAAAAELAARRGIAPLPHELWAAAPESLSRTMREFLQKELTPALRPDEQESLRMVKGKWPNYPLRIQELAKQHNLRVPWQTLPEWDNSWPRKRWDIYRLKPLLP